MRDGSPVEPKPYLSVAALPAAGGVVEVQPMRACVPPGTPEKLPVVHEIHSSTYLCDYQGHYPWRTLEAGRLSLSKGPFRFSTEGLGHRRVSLGAWTAKPMLVQSGSNERARVPLLATGAHRGRSMALQTAAPGAERQDSPLRYQRIVVKAGTNVLTRLSSNLDRSVMASITNQLADVVALGAQAVLVTSGAIAAGREAAPQIASGKGIAASQMLAAIGQSRLMNAYQELLGERGLIAAQALLTARDMDERARYLNIRNTLRGLLDRGIVPHRQRERCRGHGGDRRRAFRRQRYAVSDRGERRRRRPAAHPDGHGRAVHRRSEKRPLRRADPRGNAHRRVRDGPRGESIMAPGAAVWPPSWRPHGTRRRSASPWCSARATRRMR